MSIFRRGLFLLSLIATLSTVYIYLYPLFHRCGFADHDGPVFKLLALGDPQLEGDSSIPDSGHVEFPAFKLDNALEFLTDFPRAIKIYRKQLDLFGNDYYLAHIYRTLHWWTSPTHVTVLGDLLGSQWVTDEEFARRGDRFWNRVFRGAHKVDHDEPLGDWTARIINVVGNHDIGYAGDLNASRVARFEKTFGLVNWEIWFPFQGAELRVVILNNLNMDGPAVDADLQTSTYNFINSVILTSKPVDDITTGTILLTHVPLHKEAGVCVDGPRIDYNENGISEQNHLSPAAGLGILEGIFGMTNSSTGRPGVVLNGHDHEGCDTLHFNNGTWQAQPYTTLPGLREITVRSMMGEFGGNAGFLTAWFDGSWHFEYSACQLGVQHYWWAVHVLDLVCISGFALLFSHRVFTVLVPKRPVDAHKKRQ